jgi:sigma-B regulation protein RsbQ
MFAHGYGCDQNMWRHVAPAFSAEYKIILFDIIGSGGANESCYSAQRYSSLNAYADDILEIAQDLDLKNAIFVGHSVSAMTGLLASLKEPNRFSTLILIGPSPRYINDEGYVGGFEKSDVDDLLESLDSNYLGWADAMAHTIMKNSDRPELGAELKNSFCRMNPEIAKNFARVTFLSDNREDLCHAKARTLILQCTDDIIAPFEVGKYVHEKIANSEFVVMKATGHCPNLSAPQETIREIKEFLLRSAKN